MKKIIYLLLILLFSGCGLILSKMYGIRELREFDKSRCEDFVKAIDKKNILTFSLYADTSAFNCVRRKASGPSARKDFSQPIQILYFREDTLVSFHANCYAQGTASRLNWNTNGRFEKFIPASAVTPDTALRHVRNFISCHALQEIPEGKPCIVIVYWTLMMEKLSREAIETVIDNLEKFNQTDRVVLYLINNDQSFAG